MIFPNYTGNAMLNNALMTIEALAGLDHVSEITSEVVNKEFNKHKLWELYPRMKSYTMLFTRNGPLLNDAKFGESIYRNLIQKIVSRVEKHGQYQCEISGIWYSSTFSDLYNEVLNELHISKKDIEGKDKTINRCWFPLIGALGSDAQALPQAKFDIHIHPICLVVIQFLPLSALLYRGGIMLFDVSNYHFSKDFITKSVDRVREAIRLTPENQQVENVKDFDKGKFLLRAIELFSEKQTFYGDYYTDINLWSFTNSGTGASCSVDRVPSRVFRNLLHLFKKSNCQPELIKILNNDYAVDFINAIQNGWDYEGLYPKKDFDGVSIAFFEEYQLLIGKADHLEYAKYIAGLMKRIALTKSEEKMLLKTDAYKQQEYVSFFQKILVEGAARDEWSLAHHIDIIEDSDAIPVKSTPFWIFKKVHFYYQKDDWESVTAIKASENFETTLAGNICAFAIKLIEKDSEEEIKNHQKALKNIQEYNDFSMAPILVRQCGVLDLAQASKYFFNNYRLTHHGLTFLFRVYFSQTEYPDLPEVNLPPGEDTPWLKRLEAFSEFYTIYYIEKYGGDWSKFKKHVLLPFPKNSGEFQRWLNATFENMRDYFIKKEVSTSGISQFEETLFYDDNGNYNAPFTRFAIQFCLNQQYRLNSIINH